MDADIHIYEVAPVDGYGNSKISNRVNRLSGRSVATQKQRKQKTVKTFRTMVIESVKH